MYSVYPTHNNYHLIQDYLSSYYSSYANQHKGDRLFFATIQPASSVYTPEQAQRYLDKLLPNTPYILQLEKNDKETYIGRQKSYDLLDTLHLHIVIAERYLHLLPDLVIYTNSAHLQQIKKEKSIRQLPATAREVYSVESLFRYLSKQYTNNLLPIKKEAKKVSVKLEYEGIKPIYEGNKSNKTSMNPFVLIQLLTTGHVYRELVATERKKKKEKKEKSDLLMQAKQGKAFTHTLKLRHKRAEVRYRLPSCLLPQPPPTQYVKEQLYRSGKAKKRTRPLQLMVNDGLLT